MSIKTSFLLLLLHVCVDSTPIVNGKPAAEHQFPFAVVFAIYEKGGELKRFCGGTLVKSNSSHFSWAIGSAHCFLDSNIRNRTIYFATGGTSIRAAHWSRVEAIFTGDVNIYTLQNDIALIKMKSHHHHAIVRRATRLPHVPEANVDGEQRTKHCQIYGYGSVSDGPDRFPNRIHYARVRLISFKLCAALLGRVTAPLAGSAQFCAMGRRRADACSGDSGSGLICDVEDGSQAELVGITSYGGVGCAARSAGVGVYISVAHHKNWIEAVMRREEM